MAIILVLNFVTKDLATAVEKRSSRRLAAIVDGLYFNLLYHVARAHLHADTNATERRFADILRFHTTVMEMKNRVLSVLS